MNAERASAAIAPQLLGAAIRYRLHQSFTYDYDGPAHDLRHRLVVVPPAAHGDQRLLAAVVDVSDPDAAVSWSRDRFGNQQCLVRLAVVPTRLRLTVSLAVERGGPGSGPLSPSSNPGELVQFRSPSALTTADNAIAALAREHVVVGDELASADAFCTAVRDRVRYGFGATSVATTAAQALSIGTGVCQDQAHLMLALCRQVGMAARYVSGHLIGQGGTHAWTEVFVPGRGYVAYDPCHARRADARYVTVAVGRDYRDVPPTSGSYAGSGQGRLSTSRLLESEPVAA